MNFNAKERIDVNTNEDEQKEVTWDDDTSTVAPDDDEEPLIDVTNETEVYGFDEEKERPSTRRRPLGT